MKTTLIIKWSVSAAAGLMVAGCATYPDQVTTRQMAEKMVFEAFDASTAHMKRLEQDRSQHICSKIGDLKLSQEEAAEVVNLARASIKYPASGQLSGDWKAGDRLAHDGAGDRIRNGKTEANKQNGALCQNCHALAPGEINVGNVGPPLTGYGKQRGNSEAIVKYTYEKIYNAWAYFPCSNMPRLGATGHLTPEQVTHMVAYLLDPQSPINK
ncbi:MAG: sulfur oxidation c-type cytochrome SoxX [Betaproteobacteria bacterium]